jgi:hypothetical protein
MGGRTIPRGTPYSGRAKAVRNNEGSGTTVAQVLQGDAKAMREKDWRIIGQYRNCQTFLIVVGKTPDQCIDSLRGIFDEWTHFEIAEIRSIWTEKWKGCWVPVEEIDLKRYRMIAAYRERHTQQVTR